MFTIFGASGNTGSVVARELLGRGERVRVVARDPQKVASLQALGAEVVSADVFDVGAVRGALEGARGAYVLLPPDVRSDDYLARNRRIASIYADAVKAAQTPHVVLLSSIGAHIPAGTGPIVGTRYAEQVLSEVAGTRFTFARGAYFMENLLGYAQAMKSDGALPVFGGGSDIVHPMVATRDIGLAVAEVLVAPPSQNEILELSGPREYSFEDVAAIATRLLGRSVKTLHLPIDAFVPTFTSFGFSANLAGLYREMTQAMASGKLVWDRRGRRIQGKTTLDELLKPALG